MKIGRRSCNHPIGGPIVTRRERRVKCRSGRTADRKRKTDAGRGLRRRPPLYVYVGGYQPPSVPEREATGQRYGFPPFPGPGPRSVEEAGPSGVAAGHEDIHDEDLRLEEQMMQQVAGGNRRYQRAVNRLNDELARRRREGGVLPTAPTTQIIDDIRSASWEYAIQKLDSGGYGVSGSSSGPTETRTVALSGPIRTAGSASAQNSASQVSAATVEQADDTRGARVTVTLTSGTEMRTTSPTRMPTEAGLPTASGVEEERTQGARPTREGESRPPRLPPGAVHRRSILDRQPMPESDLELDGVYRDLVAFDDTIEIQRLTDQELEDIQSRAASLMKRYDTASGPLLEKRRRMGVFWRDTARESERRLRVRASAWDGAARAAREALARTEEERDRYRQEGEAQGRRARASEEAQRRAVQCQRQAEEQVQSLRQDREELRRRVKEAEKSSDSWRRKYMAAAERRTDTPVACSTGATPRGGGGATPAGSGSARSPARQQSGHPVVDKKDLYEEFLRLVGPRQVLVTPDPDSTVGVGTEPEMLGGLRTAGPGSARGTPAATQTHEGTARTDENSGLEDQEDNEDFGTPPRGAEAPGPGDWESEDHPDMETRD